MSRTDDLNRFYDLLDKLEENLGGKQSLTDCDWDVLSSPGILFFFEENEFRNNSSCQRVVHVGASDNMKRRLRGEIKSGNQEGAVLRKHIGKALVKREKLPQIQKHELKNQIGNYLKKNMSLLFVFVPDEQMDDIKQNSTALLSGCDNPAADRPSDNWLGKNGENPLICKSGLWNVFYVKREYDPAFLDRFAEFVRGTSLR